MMVVVMTTINDDGALRALQKDGDGDGYHD